MNRTKLHFLGFTLLMFLFAVAPRVASAQGTVADALNQANEALSQAGLQGEAGAVGGDAIYTCNANQRVVIDGKKLEKKTAGDKDKTAVVVRGSGNCSILIRGAILRGVTGIHISGNASVIIEDSQIEAKDTALHVSGNASIHLVRSQLSAKTGVKVSGNASIVYDKKSRIGKVKKSGLATITAEK